MEDSTCIYTFPGIGSASCHEVLDKGMRSGDVIRDAQGNTYQVGEIRGRGLWGTSYLVRREVTDTYHILKCPIGPDDFRTEVPGGEALFEVTRTALSEQARLYESGQFPFLPRIEARFTLQDGQPAYLIPRYPKSLEDRLRDGIELASLLDVLLKVGTHIRQLSPLQGVHGNLRPSNILFNERGDVILTDALTPVVRHALPHLVAIQPIPRIYPPEVTAILEGASGEIQWNTGIDSYILSCIFLQSVLVGEPLPPLAREGVSRTTAIHLKNRITERLKQEESNPRFHQRLADRACVLLTRALSRDPTPSPPYRFNRLDEFLQRLEEVYTLVRPRIHTMGKVLMDRTPVRPWFSTDEAVAFSCTVGTTSGVEGDSEIGVGVAVFDLDQETRVKPGELGCSINKHPSGRFRFQFSLNGLNPGRYRCRLAFTIQDAMDQPVTTEFEFQIRPAPGWKPPALEPPNPALNFRQPTEPELEPPEAPPVIEPSARLSEPRLSEPRLSEPLPRPSENPRAEFPPRPEPRSHETLAPEARYGLEQPAEPRRERQHEPTITAVSLATPKNAPAPTLHPSLEADEPQELEPTPIYKAPPPPEPPPPALKIPRPRLTTPEPAEVEFTEPSSSLPNRLIDPPSDAMLKPPRIPIASRPPASRPAPKARVERVDPTKSWAQLPLPPARADRPLSGIDEEPSSAHAYEEELDANTTLLERILHTFRTDTYTLMMSIIAAILVILLALLFYLG